MSESTTRAALSMARVLRNGSGDWIVLRLAQGDTGPDYRDMAPFLGLESTFYDGKLVEELDKTYYRFDAYSTSYSTSDEYYGVVVDVDLSDAKVGDVPAALLGPNAKVGEVHYAGSQTACAITAWLPVERPIDATVQRAVDRARAIDDPDAKTVALMLATDNDVFIELPKATAERVAELLGVNVVFGTPADPSSSEAEVSIYFSERT